MTITEQMIKDTKRLAIIMDAMSIISREMEDKKISFEELKRFFRGLADEGYGAGPSGLDLIVLAIYEVIDEVEKING